MAAAASAGSSHGVSFTLSTVYDVPNSWGPPAKEETRYDLEYKVYDKHTSLKKVADWDFLQRRKGQYKGPGDDDGDSEGDNYRLKDRTKERKSKFQNNRGRGYSRGNFASRGRGQGGYKELNRGRNRQQKHQFRRPFRHPTTQIEIPQGSEVKANFNFGDLAKLSFNPPPAVDVDERGETGYYDPAYDKLTPKTCEALRKYDRLTFFKVGIKDDPVMKRIMKEELRRSKTAKIVATTEVVLATLMAATRSQNPWLFTISRLTSTVMVMDMSKKRDLTFLDVNETAPEAPLDIDKEDLNCATKLSQEATLINLWFTQNVLKRGGERYKGQSATGDDSHPYGNEDEEPAMKLYRYRLWDINSEQADGFKLLVRCEIDAVHQKGDNKEFLRVFALNEYDPKKQGTDWVNRLDKAHGAVLGTEIKNNSCKLAKWTAMAHLSGADALKLGYVTRVNPRVRTKHSVLAMETQKPTQLAKQIGFHIPNIWGVAVTVIREALKLSEDKDRLMLVRDIVKPTLQLYKVSGESSDEDEGEEEEESESSDSSSSSSGSSSSGSSSSSSSSSD